MTAERRRAVYLVGAVAAAIMLIIFAVWACEDPWVEIGSPGEGDEVSGDTPIEATPVEGGDTSVFSLRRLFAGEEAAVPDVSKIARAKFIAAGKPFATLSQRAQYSAVWDTTQHHDGHTTLKIEVYDAAGKYLGRSRSVHVTIANLLVIDEPTKREAVSGTTTVSGDVAKGTEFTELRLYVAGELLAKTDKSPFSFEWDSTSVPDGEHILRVKAYDGKTRLGHCAVRVVVKN